MSEPPTSLADPTELLLGYLEYGRRTLVNNVSRLAEEELRVSKVPSGWTPIGLLSHMAFAERHWFAHVFAGEPMEFRLLPNGKRVGGWRVPESEGLPEVLDRYQASCDRSRQVVAPAEFTDLAVNRPHSRPDRNPTLAWIVSHMVHEYVRHLGHLDIVTELR